MGRRMTSSETGRSLARNSVTTTGTSLNITSCSAQNGERQSAGEMGSTLTMLKKVIRMRERVRVRERRIYSHIHKTPTQNHTPTTSEV